MRFAAQQKQIAAGNHPDNTRLTYEEHQDRPWDVLLGPRYREAQAQRRKMLESSRNEDA